MLRRLATKFLVFDWIFGGIINRKFEYTKALDTFFFNLTEVKSWVERRIFCSVWRERQWMMARCI